MYAAYKIGWNELQVGATADCPSDIRPSKELVYKSFTRVWRMQNSCLKFSNGGTDYCDTFVALSRYIRTLSGDAKQISEMELREHRRLADLEYKNYQSTRESVISGSECDTIHLVMDFAEKVHLPSVLDQPGNLHFTTGIKFDIFGISSSNFRNTFLYGLPKGHWKGGTRCDEVLSIFGITKRKAKSRMSRGSLTCNSR